LTAGICSEFFTEYWKCGLIIKIVGRHKGFSQAGMKPMTEAAYVDPNPIIEN
jgi:hypothetical protein